MARWFSWNVTNLVCQEGQSLKAMGKMARPDFPPEAAVTLLLSLKKEFQ
jgi:hypothetical protein